MQSYSRCVQASKVWTSKIRVFCVNLANIMTNFGCILLWQSVNNPRWRDLFYVFFEKSFANIYFVYFKFFLTLCVFLWQSVDIARRRDFFHVGSCYSPTEPSGDLLCFLPFFPLTKCDTWSIKKGEKSFFLTKKKGETLLRLPSFFPLTECDTWSIKSVKKSIRLFLYWENRMISFVLATILFIGQVWHLKYKKGETKFFCTGKRGNSPTEPLGAL